MAQTTTTTRDEYLRKYPIFLRPAVLMVILTIEISVQLWKSVFRHGLPLTDKIATRTALTNYWLHAHPPRIRKSHMKFSYTFCLGGISFFLFVLLTITGLFLMFYYVPSVQYAYQNMKDLQYAVSFGIVMRNLHRWGAHAMVITVWLHMCRVFYTGSYKPPREFNWGIGVTLLLMTLLLSFTGYLLPWDQLSLWAVTVGTNMAKYAPIAGPQTRFSMLGSYTVGNATILRFYVVHVLGLPLLASIAMMVHFWRVRKDGFSGNL
jgi:quinol-cytochrome oxidoreductase complex cytochrome b subunit